MEIFRVGVGHSNAERGGGIGRRRAVENAGVVDDVGIIVGNDGSVIDYICVVVVAVVMGASDESEIATDSNVQRIASASDAEKSVWVMESED